MLPKILGLKLVIFYLFQKFNLILVKGVSWTLKDWDTPDYTILGKTIFFPWQLNNGHVEEVYYSRDLNRNYFGIQMVQNSLFIEWFIIQAMSWIAGS